MRNGWQLVGCTLAGIFFCFIFGGGFTVHDLQTRRAVMAASIVVGALAGFGFYELKLWASKNERK